MIRPKARPTSSGSINDGHPVLIEACESIANAPQKTLLLSDFIIYQYQMSFFLC